MRRNKTDQWDVAGTLCVVAIIALSVSMVVCFVGSFFQDPYISYHNSNFRFDEKNRKIEIADGYVMDEGHSYEWVETESGYDLVIHFVKGE